MSRKQSAWCCAILAIIGLCWYLSSTGRVAKALQKTDLHAAPVDVRLPLEEKATRFGVIGDNGNGRRVQYEVAEQIVRYRAKEPFDFVVMLGDNIYGGKSAADFKRKFEDPYKELLQNGVKFFAALGNHDDPNERFYKPFNMDGKRYYNFKRGDATFFALDSTYMDSVQLQWLDKELSNVKTPWKICYFHHPLYSDAKHGPDLDLRSKLEPIFERHRVQIVLAGHEHVYERFHPIKGITHFILGNSGQLRYKDLRKSAKMAKGFDTDRGFGIFEVSPTKVSYHIISRLGTTIDAGFIDLPATVTPSITQP